MSFFLDVVPLYTSGMLNFMQTQLLIKDSASHTLIRGLWVKKMIELLLEMLTTALVCPTAFNRGFFHLSHNS